MSEYWLHKQDVLDTRVTYQFMVSISPVQLVMFVKPVVAGAVLKQRRNYLSHTLIFKTDPKLVQFQIQMFLEKVFG